MSDSEKAVWRRQIPGLLMFERLSLYLLSYPIFSLELGLLFYIVARGQLKKLANLAGYLAFILIIDGAARSFFLYRFGYSSSQYNLVYWISEPPLGIAAFLVMSSLFRRACRNQEKMWSYGRLLIVMVFLVLVVVSFSSLSLKSSSVLIRSIVAFEQNLYFTCLVLNTLLYIFLQQIDSEDDQLALLVLGMGTQFAAPAASWALWHLFPHDHLVDSLVQLVAPMCTLAMLGIWTYAVVGPSLPVGSRVVPKKRLLTNELNEISAATVAVQ